MKTARQIQMELAKERQQSPARHVSYILRMRKEAIEEIRKLLHKQGTTLEQGTEDCKLTIHLSALTDGERGRIKLLMEMFEITDEEISK